MLDSFVEKHAGEVLETAAPHFSLSKMLIRWCEASPLPLALLVDAINSQVGNTLVSVLRRFHSGYHKCPARFPQSVNLCGVRDVRDYCIHANSGKKSSTGGSAFQRQGRVIAPLQLL